MEGLAIVEHLYHSIIGAPTPVANANMINALLELFSFY